MRIIKSVAVITVGLAVSIACDPIDDTGETAMADTVNDDGSRDDDGNADGPANQDPFGAVTAHNNVRANAQPSPQPSLPPVAWDDDLAAVAQQLADACVFAHSGNEFGENIYVGTGTPSATDAITAWADEVLVYDYPSNGCAGVCGHYTQLVWRDTTRIGCAFADCDAVGGIDFAGRLWFCSYDPPGNFVGQHPY